MTPQASTQSVPTEPARVDLRCADCDRALECCAFCEAQDCSAAICYRCLVVALGEAGSEIHTHGG